MSATTAESTASTQATTTTSTTTTGGDRKAKFNDGDKVFCFHGPLLYEGKIQKTKVKDKVCKYLVHYSGWNTKWDEWVAESRVMEHCEDTIKKQKELKQQHLLSKKGKAKGKEEKKEEGPPPVVPPPPSKKRKGRGTTNEIDPSSIKKVEVKIVIPHDLRRYLLDDSDFVTRQKQLVPLPKSEDLSVRGITKKYELWKEEVQKDDVKGRGITSEVCRGINEYFNIMLGSQLLYKFERTQYGDLLKEHTGKQICDIYGAEHLLRLFVKLGRVLPYSYLDEPSMEFVVVHIHDFLEFLMKNSEDLFVPEYENSTPDYHRRSAI